jgi:hypothetical protein
MKLFILVFVCGMWAGALALADTPLESRRAVNVAAGELTEAVESLAEQCEVDVVYPSGLLNGRSTQGVNGTLATMDAFKRLLEGTPLLLREQGGALLITEAERARKPVTAVRPMELFPEVQIVAWRDDEEAPRSKELSGAPAFVKWERRTLNMLPGTGCISAHPRGGCDRMRNAVKSAVRLLGGRDLYITGLQAKFSVLVPADSEDPGAVPASTVGARWVKVTHENQVEGIAAVLPLFTTRNLETYGLDRFSVEMLLVPPRARGRHPGVPEHDLIEVAMAYALGSSDLVGGQHRVGEFRLDESQRRLRPPSHASILFRTECPQEAARGLTACRIQ